MKQRLIGYGEKIIGVPIPAGKGDVYESMKYDRYAMDTDVMWEQRHAGLARRHWWIDVAKVGIQDLVRMATGAHPGYLVDQQNMPQSAESVMIAADLAEIHQRLINEQPVITAK